MTKFRLDLQFTQKKIQTIPKNFVGPVGGIRGHEYVSILLTFLGFQTLFSPLLYLKSHLIQVETNDHTVVEPSGTSDADKDGKKEPGHESTSVKSEAHKASTSLPSAPSIQEPMLKAETKDEEMIHDSDFEEPSGVYSLFTNN